VRAAVTEVVHGTPIEVWFQDEARVGQQGTLTRIWAIAQRSSGGTGRRAA
jgi:hypothetical protein